MVQILPILAAATLLAQSAFGAAVPVKRTQHNEVSNNNQYESNRNQESNQYNQNEYQYNQYDQAQQQQQQNQHEQNQNQNEYEQNQYQNNEYNQAQQNNQYENQYENNQYENQYQNEYQQQQQQQHEVTTTLAHEVTSTAEAYPAETTIVHEQQQQEQQYGSGSSNWNGYNDCVNTCMAQFGAPPAAVPMNHENMPSPDAPVNANANPNGAIHTVMVAPDGVGLRYVPFAVNASVGDTVRYVWTTNANHTVTLSSALTICNRSALAEERNFASGVRSASAGTQTFDVVVETEEPQFFYCSVAQHCIKGMFGIINPGSDYTGANTVRTYMSTMLESNPQWAAANEYIRQNISSSADNSALNWGNDISLEGLTEEQRSEVVSNVMFTRAVFGANPGMAELDQGAATPDGSPIMIPQGLNVLLSNTALNPPSTTIEAGSFPTPTGTGTIVAPLANGAFSTKAGATGVWAAAFVGVLGYLLI